MFNATLSTHVEPVQSYTGVGEVGMYVAGRSFVKAVFTPKYTGFKLAVEAPHKESLTSTLTLIKRELQGCLGHSCVLSSAYSEPHFDNAFIEKIRFSIESTSGPDYKLRILIEYKAGIHQDFLVIIHDDVLNNLIEQIDLVIEGL